MTLEEASVGPDKSISWFCKVLDGKTKINLDKRILQTIQS